MSAPHKDFEIQGHRGARGLFPENTIEGFSAAIAMGVRVLELDVAMTADGVPVVFHDARLNPSIVRNRNGAWIDPPGAPIHTLRWSELVEFDVGRLRSGSDYATRYPRQQPRDGSRIPTLASVFALAVAAGARVDAELKTLPDRPDDTAPPDEMAHAVIEAAERAGALGHLDIRSFDWRGLRAARALRPDIPITLLTNDGTEQAPVLWWAISASAPTVIAAEWPGATWAPEYPTLTRSRVDEAHNLGLRVIPWTVNDPEDARRMIEWGCDGLCTDVPDVVFPLLA